MSCTDLDARTQAHARLREAFVNASEYEEMYNALLEENRELLLRESLAAEEVETLAMQNADLLGHGNGDQKISYVDSLRRDMALTKHVSFSDSADALTTGARVDEVDAQQSERSCRRFDRRGRGVQIRQQGFRAGRVYAHKSRQEGPGGSVDE